MPQLLSIYNHYVIHTPITFDLVPLTLEQRRSWFDQHFVTPRHQLWVAEEAGDVIGYASSHQFRVKAAYDSTVETTVYCHPNAVGRGLGTALYQALFDALRGEDIASYVAAITLPNQPSVKLHDRFGFKPIGTLHRVGRKFDSYWDVGWFELLVR